jgi:hypothetical protein
MQILRGCFCLAAITFAHSSFRTPFATYEAFWVHGRPVTVDDIKDWVIITILGPLIRTVKTTAIGFGAMVGCQIIGVKPVILLIATVSTLYPLFTLIPMFSPIDRSRSIPSSLKEHISPLCSKVGFPVDDIYISSDQPPGHAFSLRLMGTKVILVGDNSDYSLEEQSAVIAHELGHIYNNDSAHSWPVRHLYVLRYFAFLAFYARPELLSAFELPPTVAISLVYQIFTMVSDPVFTLVKDLIYHAQGQASEFAADDFAKRHRHGEALVDVLEKLKTRSGGFVATDKLFSIYTSSHPPGGDRIARLREGSND